MRPGLLIHGRYRLMEQIGAGGNGTVWRAGDETLGRVVAVKHAVSPDDVERIELLRREATILARLNHANIVTLFDVVAEDVQCWLVMEYVQASDLGKLGMLPQDRVARLGAQLADALATVHAAGILHRDIKPSNVLVTEGDRAKLGDFGISRSMHDNVTLTGSGGFTGTPAYTAPEVANGQPPDAASDIFSLGATLYAAVEGVSPYGQAHSPIAMTRRAAEGKVNPSSRAGPLAPALFALLRIDPADRPSASEARSLLLGEESIGAGDGPVGAREAPTSDPSNTNAEYAQTELQWAPYELADTRARLSRTAEELELANQNLARLRKSRHRLVVALALVMSASVLVPAVATWAFWPVVSPDSFELSFEFQNENLRQGMSQQAWHHCVDGWMCGFTGTGGTGRVGYAPGCELNKLGDAAGKLRSIKTHGNGVSLLDSRGRSLMYVPPNTETDLHPRTTRDSVAIYVHCDGLRVS